MSDELYKAASFPCYQRDLLADTGDLTLEEFGAYWKLICREYEDGSIPAQVPRLARLLGCGIKEMGVIWSEIGRFFSPHPSLEGRLVQRRLESVREEQRLFAEASAARGRAGARSRWRKPPLRDATALPKQCLSSAQALQTQSSSNASVDSTQCVDDAKPMLGDGSPLPLPSPYSPPVVPLSQKPPLEAARDFCAWYIAAAQSAELLRSVIDPAAWAFDGTRNHLALRLLGTYGRENCEARSLALFRAVVTRRLQRVSAELRDLERCWDYDAVVEALGDMRSSADVEDDLTRRLRLAEAQDA